MNINAQLEPGRFYHIYNRGINGETIFKEEKNYQFFLSKYLIYISPVVETYSYYLLKNHFHLLIRIQEQNILNQFYSENFPLSNQSKSEGLHTADFVVSKQFARLFSSYTQSVNKSVTRTGSLIETPFKRIEVKSNAHLSKLLWYIHYNPQKHGFIKDFREYPHSSYQSHLLKKPTKLQREEVLNWFGGATYYQQFHLSQQTDLDIQDYLIEFD
ncbi:MAG: hypothetical protein H7329_07405 [Opitutaceae bacterium]|nr:hypothetical protein [Cytophagales bacterium]